MERREIRNYRLKLCKLWLILEKQIFIIVVYSSNCLLFRNTNLKKYFAKSYIIVEKFLQSLIYKYFKFRYYLILKFTIPYKSRVIKLNAINPIKF